MERGYYKVLVNDYRELRQHLPDLAEESHYHERAEASDLERCCLTEHGSHEDDGSWFIGFCTRCGACLG